MQLSIPDPSLVLLIGPSGSGKSTFARRRFARTEIVSSDECRAVVSDDEQNQAASHAAFEVLNLIVAKRLTGRRLTVVDATNVDARARKPLLALAREYSAYPVALVFDLPEEVCQERNRQRLDRIVPPEIVHEQWQRTQRSLSHLASEGFGAIEVLGSVEAIERAAVARIPLPVARLDDHGPLDIIGDIHGCYDELSRLMTRLGYDVSGSRLRPPAGRRALFLGDLVDRGPEIPQVLRLAMEMVARGTALCLPGNHDDKLLRKLMGRNVRVTHGLETSLAQLAAEPPAFCTQVADFLDGLVSHYVLDDWRLVVAHAGMTANLQGRWGPRVRDFALYGETTGETDEFGLPVRINWAASYEGRALVVYGHTPVAEPVWVNRTINIDTGCVFGGRLTALRYPELELVSVPAARAYAHSPRPFLRSDTPPANAAPAGEAVAAAL